MKNTSYEHISNENAHSEGRTDANLANDSNHLGGIPADEYATQKYVRDYHDAKEELLKQYVDERDENILNTAKEFTNSAIRNQDFSHFAKDTDLNALRDNIEATIDECETECNSRIDSVVSDVNDNFDNVNSAIGNLQTGQEELFTSVSSGKRAVAGAITDKGVPTSATATFSTMANNIMQISGGSGEKVYVVPEGYMDTSGGNATPQQLLRGYTAYSNGQEIHGALVVSTDPDSGQTIIINDGTNTEVEEIYGAETLEYNTAKIYSSEKMPIYTGVDEDGELIDSGITANYAGRFCADGANLIRYMTATVDGNTERYIFINEVDEHNMTPIHITVDRHTGARTMNKYYYTFEELGLDATQGIGAIKVGKRGFKGYPGKALLCIIQGTKIHFYSYSGGKICEDEELWHWEKDTDITGLGAITNSRLYPNVFAVIRGGQRISIWLCLYISKCK